MLPGEKGDDKGSESQSKGRARARGERERWAAAKSAEKS